MNRRRGNGEGSIRQRSDGRWQASLRHRDPITGLAKRTYVYGSTRADVQDQLRMIQARLDKGKSARAERASVREFLEYWIDDVAKPSLRASTFRSYDGVVRNHLIPAFGEMQIAQLRASAIQHVLVGKGAKAPARTRELALIVLRRALEHAVRTGLLDQNPAERIDPPRVERKEMRVLTPEEVTAFLAAARSERLYALYFLAIYTGMRQGELLALRWRDVDLAAQQIRVVRTLDANARTFGAPKTTTSRRVIDLGPNAVAQIRAHRERMRAEGVAGELVFVDTGGKPLRASNVIRRSFHPLLERAKLKEPKKPSPVRFHDLRHTAATLMLAAGVHPKIVSERLGHATVTITMDLYQHVLPSMQRAAAASVEAFLAGDGGQKGGQLVDLGRALKRKAS